MKDKIDVIGAGMAGLLAGCMLGQRVHKIFETQNELPNNHKALLRFKSSIVGDRLGIPFKRVEVIKAVSDPVNPLADAVAYSLRTNGTATLRSLVTAEGKIEQRFIAPPDLISRMAVALRCPIEFGHKYDFKIGKHLPKISTVPMPMLMDTLGWEGEKPEFKSVQGISITADLGDCDFCGTLYFPHLRGMKISRYAYRASVTGSRLIVELTFPDGGSGVFKNKLSVNESTAEELLLTIMDKMGLERKMLIGTPSVNLQKYAKILPINDNLRKRFMLWATEHHNVYSLGRFATWRPGLLMDDLVNDVQVIQRLIDGESSYGWK